MNTEKELNKALQAEGIFPLTDEEIESMYDSFLDDCYPEVTIAGFAYPISKVLKDVDPTVYDCGLSDYASQLEDLGYTCINEEWFNTDEVESFQQGAA